MRNPNKNFYNFLLLWSGEFISAVGSGLTSFGLGVYVFEQTGQASAMALVTLLAFLPGLLLSVPAGVLADRYDRRLLMLLGDGLSAVGLIFILICVLRGGAQVWQICVGVTISSLFSALMDPAYKATVTDLLTPEQYTKASGLIGIAGSAKYLVSPILAGFLLTLSDISLLLVIDICTFFLTVFTTLAVRGMLLAGGAATASSKKNREKAFFRELKTGWGQFRSAAVFCCLSFFLQQSLFFSVSCRPYAPQWCLPFLTAPRWARRKRSAPWECWYPA
ncbi:MAG: MFS transporter [Eisenbergiella massiliensis]